MRARRNPPAGPPPSARVLAKQVRAYAQELGVAEGRVRAWISYMVLADLIERIAGEAAGGCRFTIKGGVALELRLLHSRREHARATKHIDVVVQDPKATHEEPVREVERTGVAGTCQGFAFRRRESRSASSTVR